MNRRSFLSGIFVGGGVATPVAAFAGSSYILDEDGKPREFKNGQCPVCATMAHPYPFDALQPARRLVRCSVCHGAFFQDQEEPGEAPKDTGPGALELKRESVVL